MTQAEQLSTSKVGMIQYCQEPSAFYSFDSLKIKVITSHEFIILLFKTEVSMKFSGIKVWRFHKDFDLVVDIPKSYESEQVKKFMEDFAKRQNLFIDFG